MTTRILNSLLMLALLFHLSTGDAYAQCESITKDGPGNEKPKKEDACEIASMNKPDDPAGCPEGCVEVELVEGCVCTHDPAFGWNCLYRKIRYCKVEVPSPQCTTQLGNCCEMLIRLSNQIVSPGADLEFKINIAHKRKATVTTPLFIWIYDQSGNMVYQEIDEEYTFEYGDELAIHKVITLPSDLSSGMYYLTVGVDQMQQGSIVNSRPFQVME